MNYVEQGRGPPQRGSKVVMKAAFVEAFLTAHGLADQYAAVPHSGPSFKLWWTGVKCSSVSVEFHMDALNGFNIRSKRPLLLDTQNLADESEELVHGTMVRTCCLISKRYQVFGMPPVLTAVRQRRPIRGNAPPSPGMVSPCWQGSRCHPELGGASPSIPNYGGGSP
ncbi:hypothetical protein C8Q76DRAFT_468652 [Earliella scabrosa]|nr:hypothetical protein C8Q76DRAFT_468652 [Earliella scabrosa]